MSMAMATEERGTRTRAGCGAAGRATARGPRCRPARHEAQHIDLEARGEVGRDHLLAVFFGALGDLGEVGREFRSS
jgi:hypothetical protein